LKKENGQSAFKVYLGGNQEGNDKQEDHNRLIVDPAPLRKEQVPSAE